MVLARREPQRNKQGRRESTPDGPDSHWLVIFDRHTGRADLSQKRHSAKQTSRFQAEPASSLSSRLSLNSSMTHSRRQTQLNFRRPQEIGHVRRRTPRKQAHNRSATVRQGAKVGGYFLTSGSRSGEISKTATPSDRSSRCRLSQRNDILTSVLPQSGEFLGTVGWEEPPARVRARRGGPTSISGVY